MITSIEISEIESKTIIGKFFPHFFDFLYHMNEIFLVLDRKIHEEGLDTLVYCRITKPQLGVI